MILLILKLFVSGFSSDPEVTIFFNEIYCRKCHESISEFIVKNNFEAEIVASCNYCEYDQLEKIKWERRIKLFYPKIYGIRFLDQDAVNKLKLSLNVSEENFIEIYAVFLIDNKAHFVYLKDFDNGNFQKFTEQLY